MENYYKILGISNDASEKDILNAYKLKIKKFNNLPFLNDTDVLEIKTLKRAKFILSNTELREKYNAGMNFNKYDDENDVNDTIGNRIFDLVDIMKTKKRDFGTENNLRNFNN